MSIASILYQLIFMPLQLMFEQLYYLLGYKLTHDPGLSIIVLSITVNLLVLPLYNRADAVQEEERAVDAKLRKGVEQIKKVFKGDEQLMMLQTYYRQNNYSPFDVIKGSVSLFLEIPFFVAAYQFLSNLSLLQGASLGPISDLGRPDSLLTIAGTSINVLPIIMTVVNLLATGLFVKGMATKTKCQLYGLAFFFLVFLYNSPAGLVFYWTLNNVFNLVKTIVYKFRGAPTLASAPYAGKEQPQTKMFLAGAGFLALLTGLLIPSSVISASPQEFIIWGYFENPLWYLMASFALALGSFVLWLGVFYWLAEAKSKLSYEKFVLGFGLTGIVTYMIWGKNTSILSDTLVLANGLQNTHLAKGVNAGVVIFLAASLCFIWKRYRKLLFEAFSLGCVAVLGMSCLNIYQINSSVKSAKENIKVGKVVAAKSEANRIILSKNGKNVIVLMLDAAMGQFVPYMLQERPELTKQMSGFTYYNNVISYGSHTLFGSAPLFGGYEYTPEAMNKRSDMLQRLKHNEAMLLLPRLFSENGYKATVANLPLVNYQWVPDYTPFKEYPEIRIENFAAPMKPVVSEKNIQEKITKNKRNFYCYGFMKVLPLLIENNFYASGRYCRFDKVKAQVVKSPVIADGLPTSVMDYYQALEDLKERTKIVESGNTFLAMTNDLTHDAALFQMPDFTVEEKVDNSQYFKPELYVHEGKRLAMNHGQQVAVYHSNLSAFIKLGAWFDYLKEHGVYDNTRIILVADHAGGSRQLKELYNQELKIDTTAYFPLLMVKDFASKGAVKTDKQFMTNADVPVLALKDLLAAPVNPFTKKPITNEAKKGKQYIIDSNKYEIRYNSGNSYPDARWFSVQDNIWDMKNWRLEKEEARMPY